jgi:hypothetical protein
MKKLLIAATLIVALSSCTRAGKEPMGGDFNHSCIIDTLTIHGVPHEFILNVAHYAGGICHSPECWCLKDKYEHI